ncbi:MAG: zf-HC2 domain-containing protein [Romboutsia sp.]|uniref:zf-HC2 domain-containing protein n=1 Tax=Romboutsia sp. TaxID=1965302 RepID=UPI003F2C37DF
MKCEIIKDLLPSYVDELTSNESNIEIEKHLESCSSCKKEFDKMKEDISIEQIELNKKDIKPLKKLNKKVLKYVIITILSGITLVGSYFYFFGFGWKVNSNDLEVTYYLKDDAIYFDFELTNGRVLNAWTDVEEPYTMSFTECFGSILDDRGVHPNEFSYGIHYKNEKGEIIFKDGDTLNLKFKDKVEKVNLNKIAEELKIN